MKRDLLASVGANASPLEKAAKQVLRLEIKEIAYDRSARIADCARRFTRRELVVEPGYSHAKACPCIARRWQRCVRSGCGHV